MSSAYPGAESSELLQAKILILTMSDYSARVGKLYMMDGFSERVCSGFHPEDLENASNSIMIWYQHFCMMPALNRKRGAKFVAHERSPVAGID